MREFTKGRFSLAGSFRRHHQLRYRNRLEELGWEAVAFPRHAVDVLFIGVHPGKKQARAEEAGVLLLEEDALCALLGEGDDDARWMLLRHLLSEPPGHLPWSLLCRLFACWPEGEGLSLALEYADQHLDDGWPDELREALDAWWSKHPVDENHDVRLRITRHVSVSHTIEYSFVEGLFSLPQASFVGLHIEEGLRPSVPFSALKALSFREQLRVLSLPSQQLKQDLLWAAMGLDEDVKWPALERLVLRGNWMTPETVDALLQHPLLPQLTQIDVSMNPAVCEALQKKEWAAPDGVTASSIDCRGTIWRCWNPDGEQYAFWLLPNQQIVFRQWNDAGVEDLDAHGVYTDLEDVWYQEGDTLVFSLSDAFVIWRGQIKGCRIEGELQNTDGYTCTWEGMLFDESFATWTHHPDGSLDDAVRRWALQEWSEKVGR